MPPVGGGATLGDESVHLIVVDAGIAVLCIVGLEVGESVAATRRHAAEIGVRHIDRVVLDRVNLVDQLVRVVNLHDGATQML